MNRACIDHSQSTPPQKTSRSGMLNEFSMILMKPISPNGLCWFTNRSTGIPRVPCTAQLGQHQGYCLGHGSGIVVGRGQVVTAPAGSAIGNPLRQQLQIDLASGAAIELGMCSCICTCVCACVCAWVKWPFLVEKEYQDCRAASTASECYQRAL